MGINHKTAVEYALQVFQKEMNRTPEPTDEKDAATIGILALGIREAFSGNLITDEELASFHDSVCDLTNHEYSYDDLRKAWILIDDNIKREAIHWGFNDTVVRDSVYEWIEKNLHVFQNFVPLVTE
jgi:hypothetical protein